MMRIYHDGIAVDGLGLEFQKEVFNIFTTANVF
jgi:hypothetical protein